jgi:hypothetical protein
LLKSAWRATLPLITLAQHFSAAMAIHFRHLLDASCKGSVARLQRDLMGMRHVLGLILIVF